MTRFLKNVALATMSLIVGLIVVELVLRSTHLFGARLTWTQPDTRIGWRFTPDREYWFFNENDHAVTGRINSHGWRDRERDIEKPEGVFRVAVIGDSYVEAFQVEQDSTFVSIAENRLRSALSTPVEVMNFGRSGVAQAEEYLILKSDVFVFEPDLVVFVFVPSNDIADINPRTAIRTARPFFRDVEGELSLDLSFNGTREFRVKQKINALKQHSATVSLLAERYNILRQTRRQNELAGSAEARRLPRHLTLCTATPDEVYVENLALCKRVIEMAAGESNARGAGFMVVGLDLVYRDEDIESCRALDPTFDPDCLDRDLAAWARAVGIDFLGLQPVFRDRYNRTGETLHWSHWNYAGHRAVADALARAVRDRPRSAGGDGPR